MPRSALRFQYQQIAQEIKHQILRGELRPGGRLLSERLLGRQFQVQRNTIRQALTLLEQEGHISTEGRRGSYVLRAPSTNGGGTFLLNIHRGTAPNLTALVDGFTHFAEQAGFSVKRRSTNPLPDSSLSRLPDPNALPSDTAGLVLWPHHPIDVERMRLLNERVPLILVDQRVPGIPTDCVRFDDFTGGRLITQHLLGSGHRTIAFLTDEVFAETVQSRWEGYAFAHEDAGVHLDPRLSLLYQHLDAQIFKMTFRHLMADGNSRPTAVVCSNDLVAFSLLRFLHAEGIRVPEEIAVTGYGNSNPDYMAAISLTTIDQPFYEVGQEAARVLCERTRQSPEERQAASKDIILPVKLVVRGSTSPH